MKSKKKLQYSMLSDVSYLLVDSGSTCPSGSHRVSTLSECSRAAAAVGLQDTIAVDDYQDGVDSDPPYCYFKDGSLKFNSNGLNTGSCTGSDKCLCRIGK